MTAGNGHMARTPGGGAFLERRRFRTWESDTQAAPSARWVVVLRYALLRSLRTWYLASLLAFIAIVTVVSLVALSYDALNGTNDDDYLATVSLFLAMPGVLLLLIGAPMLAEDVRFNAPLFYFSRPLRVVDYLLGKCLHLFGLMVAAGLVPIVLYCVMVLVLGIHPVSPNDPFSGRPRDADSLAYLRAHRIDHVGEALLAALIAITGAVSTLFFATSAMVACSAYTRRAWHAAMAFVAILGSWSMLGAFVTELVKGAGQNLFGPAGWVYLVLGVPFDLSFRSGPAPPSLAGAGWAVPLAHLALIGLGVACLRLAHHRLRRLEGLL